LALEAVVCLNRTGQSMQIAGLNSDLTARISGSIEAPAVAHSVFFEAFAVFAVPDGTGN
jgi:hypothetical protein